MTKNMQKNLFLNFSQFTVDLLENPCYNKANILNMQLVYPKDCEGNKTYCLGMFPESRRLLEVGTASYVYNSFRSCSPEIIGRDADTALSVKALMEA